MSWQRPGVPCWENEAFKIFQRAGFVIVNDVLTDDQSEKVLKTCEDVARQIIEIDPRGIEQRAATASVQLSQVDPVCIFLNSRNTCWVQE